MDAHDKLQICRLVMMAISADNKIVDAEFDLLDRLMAHYGLTTAEQIDVRRRNFDFNPKRITQEIVDPQARDEAISALALAVAVDGEVLESEYLLVQSVGQTLGLSESQIERLVRQALRPN